MTSISAMPRLGRGPRGALERLPRRRIAADLVVSVAAGLAGARALFAWLAWRADLDPDTGLYAQGGLGIFPSPLGRIVGNGGPWAIALVNVAANIVLVFAVAALADRLGGSGSRAALIVLVTPLALWSMFASVDTVAAALVVSGLAWGRRGLAFASAVGFHLAALLVVASSRRRLWVYGCVVGVPLLLLTPYRGLLLEVDPVRVVSSAAATAAVFALTFAPFLLRLWRAVPYAFGGAAAAGLVATSTWETNCRYMLPAVAVAAAYSTRRRTA